MENLIKLRTSRHLTQQELADTLNVARTTYQCYEQKKSEPSIETLIKLADYFGCSIDYLLGHQTPGLIQLDSFTPAQQKLVSLIKQLNPDQTTEVISICCYTLGLPYDQYKPAKPW